MVGYDISANLIKKAEQEERESPLGIKYLKSDPENFQSTESFDCAVAVMVLPYSPDASYIKNFFASAYRNLRDGGKFVAVVFNPDFQDFDEQVGNRFFRRGSGNKVNFDFLDVNNNEVKINANLTQYSKNDYEKAVQDGGFSKFELKSLSPDEEGVKKLGGNFWDNLVKKQPYSLIVAEK